MESNDPEYLLSLSGEPFFVHIEQKYRKSVEKILRYYDIDDYTILGKAGKRELIDLFEKPNDENSTSDLIDLKKEICVVTKDSMLLKIGTKNKVVSLLKATQKIIKKNNFQQTQSRRVGGYRSTSTSNNLSDNSDGSLEENYSATVQDSIQSLLTSLRYTIHGINYTNVSAKDFKIVIEKQSGDVLPACSVRCICGDKIKLYLRNTRFQVSYLMKHLKNTNNKPATLMNDNSENLYDSEVESEIDFDGQPLISERSQSSTQKKNARIVHIDVDESDASATTVLKNSNSRVQKPRLESINSVNTPSSNKTGKNQLDGQAKIRRQAKPSGSQSTISFTPATTLKNIAYSKAGSSDILSTLLNTIDSNRHHSPNNYRYPTAVLRLATCFFILAGVYVYNFIRINLRYLLPSVETVKKFYTYNPYSEANFRFTECKSYLDSIDTSFAFVSEDCSAIIPRIEYDSVFDHFNGFITPVVDGKPIESAFSCQSFEEFQFLIENNQRANLVNVHCLQPIHNRDLSITPPPIVLAAYGTDNKLTSMDILKRWIMMYQEFHSRNIRVLGFSTDGDPKYLRAMRLASNFFVTTETLSIYDNTLAFKIDIPKDWSSWYFLNPVQMFMYMQDGVHLCTKIRNRLLSKTAKLKMGSYDVSINDLYKLIETRNKLDHNLSRSDLNCRDKQNFASCQRISDDRVLNLLSSNDQSNGTFNYLLLLNLLITAYTRSDVSLSERIFYAWVVLFYTRLWRIWLYITKRSRKSAKVKKKNDEMNYFITQNALLSIELNAHYLIYLYLSIEQKLIPESTADSVHLFSSQSCENVFRDARALSGIYSTRINFTMKQFLKRINKLNSLTELKQYELTNNEEKINFPVHHKNKRFHNDTRRNVADSNVDFVSANVQAIVHRAYESAQQMTIFVGMSKDLIKHNVFNIEQSSELAKKLLKLKNGYHLP
ncbi:unnamed protein product [Adineta ricciae]|uniref:Uncharacterized protein n=1 Tax=Adineta ricciae TaxID=249248 RepID=A0A816BKI0_ADIRI|nr:unnamed protein product [Adineta ricciae]